VSSVPELGRVPDGTLNVVDDVVEVLSASALTRERLLRLQAILGQARAGQMNTEDAVDAVADEAPSLQALIDQYGPRMRAALITFLWILVSILLAQGLAELRTTP
jgi:hypothetical protein